MSGMVRIYCKYGCGDYTEWPAALAGGSWGCIPCTLKHDSDEQDGGSQ